jgi:hypothetical protein
MSDFETLVDDASDDAFKEIKPVTRTVAQKMRALRDEFGFQPTKPKPTEEETND